MSNSIAFNVDKNILLSALSNLQAVIANRNVIQILNNVKLDVIDNKITITATDMDISLSETTEVETLTQGTLTVNAKSFYDIIRKMPDNAITVRGDADSGKVQIKSGKCKFSINCLSSEEFPLISTEDLNIDLDIAAIEFLDLLNKSKFAASNDEMKYQLCGINIKSDGEHVYADATNGMKLARIVLQKFSDFEAITISNKAVNIIIKILDKSINNFKISFSNSKIQIIADDTILVSKLIDAGFPDVSRIIPDDLPDGISINRDILLKTMDRVSLAADDKTKTIKISLKENLLIISANSESNGSCEDEIPIIYDGEESSIIFNSKLLIEMLSNISSEFVGITFNNHQPTIIKNPNNSNEIYLIMSMSA